jgi:hypothetical protein
MEILIGTTSSGISYHLRDEYSICRCCWNVAKYKWKVHNWKIEIIVLSLNNSRFGDFVDRIYPIELEIKDTTDTNRCASYLDLHLEIDSEGRLRTKLYDKRVDFNTKEGRVTS